MLAQSPLQGKLAIQCASSGHSIASMNILQFVPLLATGFAVPQLLPQLLRATRSADPSGVSAPWAALTAVSNLAWLTYFVSTGLVSAAVPTITSAVLAGAIVVALANLEVSVRLAISLALGWGVVLTTAYLAGGATTLGAVLTVAFLLQVVPSVHHIWASPRATGVSRLTWQLIAAEVCCWGMIGIADGRPPLVFLFATGVSASTVVLWLTRPAGPRSGPDRDGTGTVSGYRWHRRPAT